MVVALLRITFGGCYSPQSTRVPGVGLKGTEMHRCTRELLSNSHTYKTRERRPIYQTSPELFVLRPV